MNKMIKKISKEATKEIIANLDEGGWFREATQDEIDDYKRGLKKLIKKGLIAVQEKGYSETLVKSIITKSFNIASENNIPCISDCMMYDGKVLLFSYKHNLKSFIEEALKSCDKLHESEREKRTHSIIEEIKSRPGHNPGRVIFSSARSQQAENTREKYYAISETKLIELISDQNKLNALECGGVDNWPYYSESQHEYVSEYDEYEDLDEAFAAYSKNEIENDGANYMPIKDDKLAEAIYSPFDEEELDR